MKALALVGVFFLVCCAPQGFADSVTVGDLEYNVLSPAINDFTIDNFTGFNNLGYFPVASDITFVDSVLVLSEVDGGTLMYDLGDIGPGAITSPPLSSALSFTQATFSAMLDPGSFPLTNGYSGAFAADPSISFTLLPDSGSSLMAGIDLGTISAYSATAVPEPRTLGLLLVAFGAVLALRVRSELRRRDQQYPSEARRDIGD